MHQYIYEICTKRFSVNDKEWKVEIWDKLRLKSFVIMSVNQVHISCRNRLRLNGKYRTFVCTFPGDGVITLAVFNC